MAFAMVYVREPACGSQATHVCRSFLLVLDQPFPVFVYHVEVHVVVQRFVSEPYFVAQKAGEHFFVLDRVHVPKDDELLLAVCDPGYELVEHRKWRVRYDDVRLVAQCGHFRRAKVTVAFEVAHELHIVHVDAARSVCIVREDEQLAVIVVF